MEIKNGRDISPQSILDFADLVFSKAEKPHDFETLLPKNYAPDTLRPDRHLVAVEEGRIQAMAMYHPFTLRVGPVALNVVCVGTVCVHKKARGLGLMQKLMWELLRQDEVLEADMVTLGGQRQRYEYFGFAPGGVICRYTVNRDNVRHGLSAQKEMTLHPFSLKYAQDACRLMEQQPMYVSRETEAFERTLRSWDGEPCVFLENGVFKGYCTLVGDTVGEMVLRDAQDIPSAIKTLFSCFNKERLHFGISQWDPANAFLAAVAEEGSVGWHHLYRVNRFDRVIEAFLTAANEKKPLQKGAFSLAVQGVGNIGINIDHQGVKLALGPCHEEGMKPMEAFRALFSFNCGSPPLKTPLGWFPLPVYIPLADLC